MPESSAHPTIDLGRLAPGLPCCCGQYLGDCRRGLEEAVRNGESGIAVARRYARSLDGLLGALFCASDAAARAEGMAPRARVALVGVGGYGRGLVALHSDVDVLFLCDDPRDRHVQSLAEGVLYPLWDLGLTIGHAVRGVGETLALAREDIRTATTLLDLRRVAGRVDIVADLEERARREVFEPALTQFVDALEKDTAERQERFGGSLFLLEPEVKLGRGGLRDLDVGEWAARARWGSTCPEQHVRLGALLPHEARELDVAREMLWRVRNLLHLRAGRRQDRLTFADQEDIAKQLGFCDGVTLAVEQFMQAYYRKARVVAHASERMLSRARPVAVALGGPITEDLGDGIRVVDGLVGLVDPERLRSDPALAFRLYRQVIGRRQPPDPGARDAITEAAHDPEWRARARRTPEAVEAFLSFLTFTGVAPVRRGSILEELHSVGLVAAIIAEFETITGRVQHDVYHVYTVDVHSLRAVDRLKALVRGDLKKDQPLACRLTAEEPRPVPLYVGLLLHDIGKAHGKDHSVKGAAMVVPIARRLALSPADAEHVGWLVREHLSLYKWATRRDTSDPDAVLEVAREVGTLDRLRDLYLLTIADLSTTSPTAMTSWKSRLLDDLYLATASVLEGEIPSAVGRVRETREAARAALDNSPDRAAREVFIADMPTRYVLANTAEAIALHAKVAVERGDATVHVARAPGPTVDSAELLFVTDDRPGLLADLTAVLASNRLSVITAQIYNRPRPGEPDEAFDVFLVRREGAAEPASDATLDSVRHDLLALLGSETTAEKLLARVGQVPSWAQRHVPDVSTEVIVDNAVSHRFTVVDVFTRDRLGLLHAISRTLHEQGLTIAFSKINTEGVRAADVFYVVDTRGSKLAEPKRVEALARALRDALAQHHARWEAAREALT